MDEQIRKRERRFDATIGPHFEALHRAAMRLMRCREDAEDLVQDVALRALSELERLETLEAPRAWLLRVQYHLFVDRTRRRARSPVAAGGEDCDSSQVASEAPGPEEMAVMDQKQRQLTQVWPELSRRQRALLALHAEGYSLAELNEISGLSTNAIGVHLHRARARLAKLMRNETAGELNLVRLEG
jgi:RNA polymerase sigma-70 factor (ECF subfamily)